MDALASAAVQVPAVAVLGFVFWKICSLFIAKWSEAEQKRTEAYERAETERTKNIAQGFADIVGELRAHGATVSAIHDAVVCR